MKEKTVRTICVLLVMLSLALWTSALTPALAAEKKGKDDTRPERGLSVAFEYPGVVINKGNDATVGLLIAMAGGSFLYIGASDLIPETHEKGGIANALFLVLGILCLFFLSKMITG